MRESVIEKDVCEFARSKGYLVRKLKYIGRHGAPDRLFIGHGEAIFVEFKATDKGPELHQKREATRYKKRGVKVHVIDNIEDGRALFE